MENEEDLRHRDEVARDRDEMSRDRDELSRDRDAFSQRATRSARHVQTWATLVVIIMVAGLFYVLDQRQDAIAEIQQSAVRIEQVASHTEEILIGVAEERESPDAVAQSAQVGEALRDIEIIRQLLCELPELADSPACRRPGDR